MGAKYFHKNRSIKKNQGWNQVLPQVWNPIKQTVPIETCNLVWIDRLTKEEAKFEKMSLLQKPAHPHVTLKPSYNYPFRDYQTQSGIALLYPEIETVDKGLELSSFKAKVSSDRGVTFYSDSGYIPVKMNTLSGQNGLAVPNLETANEYHLMGSDDGRLKIPLWNSAHLMSTPLYGTFPKGNPLHVNSPLGDFLYLNERHTKIYNPDTRSQRIEYEETCHITSYIESLHQTELLLQKGVRTTCAPVTTKGHVPRFLIQYEWRYNPDRWVTVSAICYAIEQMCRINTAGETKQAQVETVFFTTVVPDIPISDYFERIAWFYDCSKECFVLVLEFIHRVTKYNPEIVVNHNTQHMLIATCLMVATKFMDDVAFDHTFYAKVVGLPALTMSALELKLLFILRFELFVHPAQYKRRYKRMLANNKGLNKVSIRP